MAAFLTEQISDFLKVSFSFRIRIMKLGWHTLVTTSKQNKFFQVIFIIFLHNGAHLFVR